MAEVTIWVDPRFRQKKDLASALRKEGLSVTVDSEYATLEKLESFSSDFLTQETIETFTIIITSSIATTAANAIVMDVYNKVKSWAVKRYAERKADYKEARNKFPAERVILYNNEGKIILDLMISGDYEDVRIHEHGSKFFPEESGILADNRRPIPPDVLAEKPSNIKHRMATLLRRSKKGRH